MQTPQKKVVQWTLAVYLLVVFERECAGPVILIDSC